METTATFDINVVGEESGNPFSGTFKVRTLLSRGNIMVADEARRKMLGYNPESAAPRIATEAFMLGQLAVRIIDSPTWWTNSKNGYDLSDSNVIEEVFKLAVDKEEDRKVQLKTQAEVAKAKVKKSNTEE